MTGRTTAIEFFGCDARQPDPWPFSTPYRAIPIPYMGGGAFEALASGNDGHLDQEKGGKEHLPQVKENDRSLQFGAGYPGIKVERNPQGFVANPSPRLEISYTLQ
jgi:hypothetical protein